MSYLMPHVTVTTAVGPAWVKSDEYFNDLALYGGWPLLQSIKRIAHIEVFVTDAAVKGMQITYITSASEPEIAMHGLSTSTKFDVSFSNEKHSLVGVFGGRNDHGAIANIGFVVFDATKTANPPVAIHGPFGSKETPTQTYGTYGNIIAFIGTDNNKTGLRALGFVKSEECKW